MIWKKQYLGWPVSSLIIIFPKSRSKQKHDLNDHLFAVFSSFLLTKKKVNINRWQCLLSFFYYFSFLRLEFPKKLLVDDTA